MTSLFIAVGMLWAQHSTLAPDIAEFLDRMKKMAGGPTLSVEQSRLELAVEFQKDQIQSNEAMTFLTGKPRPGSRYFRIIKLVDCRVPAPPSPQGQEPFVVVNLLESLDFTEADLTSRLGPPDSIDVVEPNLTLAVSLGYKLKTSWLWFGISPAPARRVISLSIHREKKEPPPHSP